MNIYNNVMAFNGGSGIILWLALSGVDIKNNIIYRSYGIGSWMPMETESSPNRHTGDSLR